MCCGAGSWGRGRGSRSPVAPEDADMGRSGAHHRAAGSGPRGEGVWETEGITSVGLLWEGSRGGAGCHGMQRKRGDRLTVLLDISRRKIRPLGRRREIRTGEDGVTLSPGTP